MRTSDGTAMKKEGKTAALAGLVILIIVFLLIIAVAVFFLLKNSTLGMRNAEPPDEIAAGYLNTLDLGADGTRYTITTDGSRLNIDTAPTTEDGIVLYSQLQGRWAYAIDGYWLDGKNATINFNIDCIDTELMAEPLRELVQENLKQMVEAAEKSEDIYDADLNFRPEVVDEAYDKALSEICSHAAENYTVTVNALLKMEYYEKQWNITNPASAVSSLDKTAAALRETATSNLEYIQKVYSIDQAATAGFTPDQSGFITTADSSQVKALLSTKYAELLMKGQDTVWNENIELIPDSVIRCYLDESLLMIEWQEEEAGMVGTFSEVFVADGSQIRRKIAGDSFGDMNFKTATAFAKETKAVLAVGGDFYNSDRKCGIFVYGGQMYRFEPSTADTCFITSDGDMLFGYRGQFEHEDEAKEFIEKNDVEYSLCFGPVMIDEGVDVTPTSYAWGEINDTYARAALGLMGEHHYLVMNINCGTGHYYHYATLRQAADAMVKRGCRKAYTLDGGQTCCTVVNGELVSPVQFGRERSVSDILYFATAVPD